MASTNKPKSTISREHIPVYDNRWCVLYLKQRNWWWHYLVETTCLSSPRGFGWSEMRKTKTWNSSRQLLVVAQINSGSSSRSLFPASHDRPQAGPTRICHATTRFVRLPLLSSLVNSSGGLTQEPKTAANEYDPLTISNIDASDRSTDQRLFANNARPWRGWNLRQVCWRGRS